MEIVEGVHLHFIKTSKFKTNHLTCRFSGDVRTVNKARRALVAQMLATANADFPTSRLFRQRLAELYGAGLSTKITTKGLVHILDIDIDFIGNGLTLGNEDLVVEVMAFLRSILFRPLRTVEQYQTATFDLEKANLINYLEADREDVFYHSDLELDNLYFSEDYLKEPKYSTADLVAKENSYTAFQEFSRMLKEDRIDIFWVGDIEEYSVLQNLHQFPFLPRPVNLVYQHQEDLSKITREKLDSRQANQSVLTLAYHVSAVYGDANYLALLVVNGLLGLFPHSLLFSELREKAGLAYTISSHLDPFRSVLKVQAGIDRTQRQRTLQVITTQFNRLKSGRFSTDLVTKTKKMLINATKLAQDSHKSLVELTYNKAVLGDRVSSLEAFEAGIQSVTKKDIIRLASAIKLQAVYFIEGEEQ